MVDKGAQRGTITGNPTSDWSSPATRTDQATRPMEYPDGPVKLGCALCTEPFVLDAAEYWGTSPEEMEVLGREFLSVRADAALCPRCLHDVEQTGAERIYWRLAHG